MSARQMAQRCPGALAFGVARLSGWQFMINQIGAAALRPNPDAEVYGVLWRCHARHMADLDRYEAVAQRVYFRDPRRVRLLPLNVPITSTVYTATDQVAGVAPIPGYVENAILPGAHEFSLPQAYIEELETWLPGGAAYPDPSVRRKSTFRYGKKRARKFTGWGGQR